MKLIKKIIKNLLCWFEIHQWIYNEDRTKRWCSNCIKTQEHWCNYLWIECIDGEPLENI